MISPDTTRARQRLEKSLEAGLGKRIAGTDTRHAISEDIINQLAKDGITVTLPEESPADPFK